MFFLFGWGHRTLKDYGSTYAVKCPNCQNTQFWTLVHSRLWFTLFFIPVFPYESKHLLLCPVCQQGIKIAGQQVTRAMELNKYSLGFVNKSIGKEEYLSHLDRLDPLAIDASGASKGMPVVQPPVETKAVPPPLPPKRVIQFGYYDASGAVRNDVFAKNTILIGSGESCDLILPSLARQHCRIYLSGGQYYAEDLGGGISVNGIDGSRALQDNDVLQAGSVSFRINTFQQS